MSSHIIGGGRAQAFWRLVYALVHIATAGAILAVQFGLAIVGFLVAAVLDWIVQAATDSGMSGRSRIRGWGRGLWKWPLRQLSWFAFREPSTFQWFPRRS